jgi:hypothetical protein
LLKAKQSTRRPRLAANPASGSEPLWNLSSTILQAMPYPRKKLPPFATGEISLLESNQKEEWLDSHGQDC